MILTGPTSHSWTIAVMFLFAHNAVDTVIQIPTLGTHLKTRIFTTCQLCDELKCGCEIHGPILHCKTCEKEIKRIKAKLSIHDKLLFDKGLSEIASEAVDIEGGMQGRYE